MCATTGTFRSGQSSVREDVGRSTTFDIEYLSGGLNDHPKDFQSLVDLPLPMTLKAMQSFLGSLNYYRIVIEDYSVYASILYGLREVNFHIRRNQLKGDNNATSQDEDEERWARIQLAFAMLKNKIVTAPILRHFDPIREAVINVYANY